ncbi:aldehyde oxidase GLOX1-like [Herrania umbratica]|uniref:Aldehyde oxidase GLOX1-like n=1 Tax=Herrania umbratica TaxID=108875 RepID=A0A6J1ABQ4_9ROSI|nr:aldehyde oxidase GLOX1-like [Herrania umbratica]
MWVVTSMLYVDFPNAVTLSFPTEVLVCGGAPKGSYLQAVRGKFIAALKTCARMTITDPNPQWVMETMPMARVMSDMILLPNGKVLIINGAGSGSAGWELGRNPVLSPVLYLPDNKIGSRFETQTPTTIPRMYHSTAVLLRDGRVLVGGSNPHTFYNFTGVLFPTELSLEAFSPAYLDSKFNTLRPTIVAPKSSSGIQYGEKLTVQVVITGKVAPNLVSVTMVAPSFTTHSFSMNQRVLVLGNDKVTASGKSTYNIDVTTPRSDNLAPAGFYLLFVVHQGIPSQGIWVKLR